MRPIDADALCRRLQKRLGSPEGDDKLMEVNYEITRAPTLTDGPRNPTEARVMWVEDDVFKTLYRCSRCRGGAPITVEFMRNKLTKFCPYCGAEMENWEDG